MRKSGIKAMALSLGLRVFAAAPAVTAATAVSVPTEWIDKYYPGTVDYEAVAKQTAANGLNTVEEAYVAGLDPTNAASVFTASVALSNGMVHVCWAPNLNVEGLSRIYRRSGRTTLDSDDWETPVRPWHRFFTVSVAMPTGEAGETSDVSGEGFVPQGRGVQLWENGPYWAECNVGASKPEEYGYYFWWGDTVGYRCEGGTWVDHYYDDVTWVSSTGERMVSSPFPSTSCPTMGLSKSQLQEAGYSDSTGNLVASHDAATVHLGAPWRMPTAVEMQALVDNCDTTWTTRGGVYGRLVTGRGAYATKGIFLPAAGYGYDFILGRPGLLGNYWCSTPNLSLWDYAHILNLYSGDFTLDNRCGRYYGQPVRPVR